jgi:hypothetical protein
MTPTAGENLRSSPTTLPDRLLMTAKAQFSPLDVAPGHPLGVRLPLAHPRRARVALGGHQPQLGQP